MRFATLLLTAALAATASALPRETRAQAPADQLESGVRAWQQLDLTAAARALRQALASDREDSLTTPERTRALMFLFATESLRERRDSAAAAAVQLLRISPQYRPDAAVFPPELVAAFQDVQRSTRIVVLRAPATMTLAPNDPAFTVSVVVSAPQQLTINALRENGSPFMTVFAGAVADSTEVRVDARDSSGTPLTPGRYQLAAITRDERGRARLTRVPFEVLGVSRMAARTAEQQDLIASASFDVPRASLMAGVGRYASRSDFASGGEYYTGVGLFGEGTFAFGRFRLRANYGEAKLTAQQNGSADRQVVEGAAMLGIQTLSWLTLWAGPHARTYMTADRPSERWLVWEVRLAARPVFAGNRIAASLETWGVASANVDAPAAFERGMGGEGALAYHVGESPFWIGASYRRELAALKDNVRRENNGVASVFLRMDVR